MEQILDWKHLLPCYLQNCWIVACPLLLNKSQLCQSLWNTLKGMLSVPCHLQHSFLDGIDHIIGLNSLF